MPPMIPPSSANHGPYSQPHHPAKIVPRTIMPSRPMLIVPLRSATRPDKPARPIGAAVRNATPNVPLDVRSAVSDRIRVVERTANAPTYRGKREPARRSPARRPRRRCGRRRRLIGDDGHIDDSRGRGRELEPGGGRRGRRRGGRRVAPVDHLVGDHGGEQERPLQDPADLRRDADRRQSLRRPFDRRPHDGGRGDADGIVPTEQREARAR